MVFDKIIPINERVSKNMFYNHKLSMMKSSTAVVRTNLSLSEMSIIKFNNNKKF